MIQAFWNVLFQKYWLSYKFFANHYPTNSAGLTSETNPGGFMKTVLVSLFISALSVMAQAQTSQIGAIVAAGSGCQGGNIKTSVRAGTISVAYPDFEIQYATGSAIQRQTCSLAIPVSVPQGFQLVAVAASSGLARLEKNDSALISHELFTAGARGVNQQLTAKSSSKLYTIGKISSSSEGVVKSACGQSTNLRLNISIVSRKTDEASQSKISLSKSQIALKLVRCK